MYETLRPLLFTLDAEAAHRTTLGLLELAARCRLTGLLAASPAPLPVRAFGLEFPHPVGLAAGLDKNGEHVDALGALGLGFIEVGTVTPRPQSGNPRPRLFRLPAHQAIVNRMGFNNAGVEQLLRNLDRARWNGVLGINIGKNKDTPNERAADDYLHCLERVHARASYVTVNISSPNTQGLRDLQQEETLRRFVGSLREAQERLGSRAGARKPMLVKIAPDLSEAELDAVAEVLLSARVDGAICTNTTLDRAGVAGDPLAGEAGGLSGLPLRERAEAVLRGLRERSGGRLPLIGVGGIVQGEDAAARMRAGACLVQVYSGLIYRGPALIGACVDAIRRQQESADAA